MSATCMECEGNINTLLLPDSALHRQAHSGVTVLAFSHKATGQFGMAYGAQSLTSSCQNESTVRLIITFQYSV